MLDTETEPVQSSARQLMHARTHAAAGESRTPARFPAPIDDDDELEPTIVRGRE
ncbi:hypothetical protein SacmaDRAFT_1183 [Saccharomonospora marina XMU15]|uniref:Uncharacterized protein n=1 Tax=Saccharomonospora marina XMU15 TaxID=882083 RepID=H5WXD7_9PSEU|nr:hypothetical protein [Saccharomonospora marina]EHR49466.1 hypothetical protein SacmaDRAFT_1183 [Saccharomonospora marina XMU15]